jgi:hypothetical protein
MPFFHSSPGLPCSSSLVRFFRVSPVLCAVVLRGGPSGGSAVGQQLSLLEGKQESIGLEGLGGSANSRASWVRT